MCPDDICAGSVVKDDGIPNDFITAILSQSSFGIPFTPALQERKAH
jgi:hypothetical protein